MARYDFNKKYLFYITYHMIITINGKPENVKMQSNITELILSKGLCMSNLVVEHNSRILPKHQWQDIILKENDTIEIVSFVGGG